MKDLQIINEIIISVAKYFRREKETQSPEVVKDRTDSRTWLSRKIKLHVFGKVKGIKNKEKCFKN